MSLSNRLAASNGKFLGNSDELEQGIQFLHENGLFDLVQTLLVIGIDYCVISQVFYCIMMTQLLLMCISWTLNGYVTCCHVWLQYMRGTPFKEMVSCYDIN